METNDLGFKKPEIFFSRWDKDLREALLENSKKPTVNRRPYFNNSNCGCTRIRDFSAGVSKRRKVIK